MDIGTELQKENATFKHYTTVSCKSLVMCVARSPTDLSMIDTYEDDLQVGVRLVGFFVACCFHLAGR